jgi:2-polyprenyl-3-methyl-5-hydroxy-6-metoxy-1,4-benzoquinol methylase
MLEETSCCLGCEKLDDLVCNSRDLLHNFPGLFNIVKCRKCSLMRTNPRPSVDSIGLYYPFDYGPYLGTIIKENSSDSLIKQFIKALVTWLFNSNSTKIPDLMPGRMLEVGCASGSYLHEMAVKGWQVEGIEFSDMSAQAARKFGYSVHSGPMESADYPENSFDLIVGWMVLEHLHDPVLGLKKLCKWAKPEARLVLSVPNAGSAEFSLFRDKWYALQVPTHMYHFTPQSLLKVLEFSGWRLDKVYHQRTISNLIASIGYVLTEKGYSKIGKKLINFPNQGSRLFYIMYPISWLLSLFGQTGRMTVWATRA